MGGRGRRWGRGMTRTLAVSQTALVSAEREREREREGEREREMKEEYETESAGDLWCCQAARHR